MQAKRIQVNDTTDGAGASTNVSLIVPVEPREQVNFHNIWVGASCTPQTAGANARGSWVCYTLPQGLGVLAFTDAAINAEGSTQRIIACGVFGASNEMPWTLPPTQIKTSRNLNPAERIVMNVTIESITSGLADDRVMICAHTTRA